MNRDRDEMRIDSRLNRVVVTVIAEPRQLGKNGRELSKRVRVAEKKQGGEINCTPLDSVSRSPMRDGCLPFAAKKPSGNALTEYFEYTYWSIHYRCSVTRGISAPIQTPRLEARGIRR